MSFCSLLCCTFSVSQFLNRLTKLFSSLFVKRNCTSICSFFSRLLLFNFQGTYALRFRIACLLYHKLSRLSSTFLSFFNFFLLLDSFSLFSRGCRFRRPLYYITKFLVCQGVFESFSKFFSTSLSLNRLFKLPLALGDLCSISLLSPFVNSFPDIFFVSMFLTESRY